MNYPGLENNMKGFSLDSLKVQFTLTFHMEQFQPFKAH